MYIRGYPKGADHAYVRLWTGSESCICQAIHWERITHMPGYRLGTDRGHGKLIKAQASQAGPARQAVRPSIRAHHNDACLRSPEAKAVRVHQKLRAGVPFGRELSYLLIDDTDQTDSGRAVQRTGGCENQKVAFDTIVILLALRLQRARPPARPPARRPCTRPSARPRARAPALPPACP